MSSLRESSHSDQPAGTDTRTRKLFASRGFWSCAYAGTEDNIKLRPADKEKARAFIPASRSHDGPHCTLYPFALVDSVSRKMVAHQTRLEAALDAPKFPLYEAARGLPPFTWTYSRVTGHLPY